MKLFVIVQYFHPSLQIGLEDIRSAWLFSAGKPAVKLSAIIYQGQLYYRLPVSGKRISYKQLKKGLVRKKIVIKQELLPF